MVIRGGVACMGACVGSGQRGRKGQEVVKKNSVSRDSG